ncbi:MAG: HK97 family phage prohead protease [Pseudomonadota bacterium]
MSVIAAAPVAFELRGAGDGGAALSGRFPYGVETELAAGKREVFAPHALEVRGAIYLLVQHRIETPLASTVAGSLTVRNEPDALTFEAAISREVAETSHGRDALALIRSGLAVGLSPGFRVEPGGERIERRGDHVLRTVTSALLAELSIVTRPAYDTAAVEARSWQPPT